MSLIIYNLIYPLLRRLNCVIFLHAHVKGQTEKVKKP